MKTNNVAMMLLAVGFGMGSGDHAAAQGQPSAFPSVVPDSAKGAGKKRGSSEMETSSGTFGNGDTPTKRAVSLSPRVATTIGGSPVTINIHGHGLGPIQKQTSTERHGRSTAVQPHHAIFHL